MPKALCMTGIVISILVFVLFLVFLCECGTMRANMSQIMRENIRDYEREYKREYERE